MVTEQSITGLAEQIRAGLTEDEEAARLANAVDPGPWYEDVDYDGYTNQRTGRHGDGMVYAADTVALWDREASCTLSMTAPTATHVARHDPVRVLADMAARRQLLDEAIAWRHDVHDDSWYTCPAATDERDGGTYAETDGGGDCTCGRDELVHAVLQHLAKPYQEAIR